MTTNTAIEWVDHTASPWHGCSHALLPDGTPHQGCINCYAEAMSLRNPKTLGVWGDDGTRVRSKSFPKKLREFQREAERAGERVTVFPSICDPFEDRPELVEWRREMFAAIDQCPLVDVILLTKRPQNIQSKWCSHVNTDGKPPSRLHRRNVWLVASISDQASADAMIPPLLQCRDLAPVLGVSAEPLVGPISFRWAKWCPIPFDRQTGSTDELDGLRMLDWFILGGESGHNARPMHPEWASSLRDQCQVAGVPFFFKQWGEWHTHSLLNGLPHFRQFTSHVHWVHKAETWLQGGICLDAQGRLCERGSDFARARDENTFPVTIMDRVGKKAAGRLLDGREWSQFPKGGE